MDTGFEIRLLGLMELYLNGQPLPLPATRKSQSLLAYLITYRHRPHTRERLADLFWPDRLRDKALHNLSTALWHIRRVLPPGDYILADAQTLQFNPVSDYWLDVALFERMTNEAMTKSQMGKDIGHWDLVIGHLRNAVELYRGDFLEGFYEDWCLDERYRLEGLYLEALERLVAAYEALNRPEEALRYAELLLMRDPLREDVHRTAIRLHVRLGNQVGAVRQAWWCRAVLRTELGIEPDPETVALCDELLGLAWRRELGEETLAQRRPPPRSQPALVLGRPPFVGRGAEWGTLLAHWERARSGQGHLVLVSGEAGIGKSRLVEELSQYVRQQGGEAFCERCYEYERTLPHGPLADLLRAVLSAMGARILECLSPWQVAELARLAPELGEQLPSPLSRFLPPDQEQARLFDALTSLLLELARQNPLLLVLEDIHWAHDSTLAWLHYLARRLPEAPVLLLATYRREEVSPGHPLHGLALELVQRGLATRLELTRLSCEALARWMAGASDSLVRRIHRQTEGNPFFTLETLRALFEEGQVQLVEGRWVEKTVLSSLPIPASVRQVVQARLERLSPPTRKAVATAAVMGHAFDFDILERAWGRGEEATLEALDELLRRRLVREGSGPTGRDYEFDHHLVREVIYQGLHHRRRKRLHRLVGEAMEGLYAGRPGVDGELAHHFEQAGEWARALPYLLQAGHGAAAAYAYDEALDYWERALAAFARLPEAETLPFREPIGDALIARAELFHLQGRIAERQADLRRLRQLAEETADARLLDQALIREAHYLNLDGCYGQALEKAQAAADRCHQRGDTDGESQALAEWGFAHYFRGEYEAALEPLQAALRLEQTDPATRGAVLSVLSYVHYLIADYRRSLEYRQQALAIRTALGQQARVAEDLTDIGILYTRLNKLPEAERYLCDALKLAREIGSQPAESYALNNLGNLHYLRGNYPEALKCYSNSLVLQRATGSRRGEASALGNSGMTLLALGNYEEAENLLRQSLNIQEEIGYESGLSEGLAQLAEVLMNLGRDEEALQAASRSLAVAKRIGDRYCQVTALNVLARLHLARNEPTTAAALAQEAIALAQETNLAHGYIFGLALLGLAHLALGDPQTAEQYSSQAVTLLSEQNYIEGPEEEIYLAHYRVLTALGRGEEATAALRRAHAEVMRKAQSLNDEQRRCFLEEVPINRQIMAAYKAAVVGVHSTNP